MNITALLEIKAAILSHPRQFQMDHTYATYLDDCTPAGGCGTAACIAGWAMFLRETDSRMNERENMPSFELLSRAASHLDVPNGKLFLRGDWPDQFRLPYNSAIDACDSVRMAKIAADAIDDYISTGGWV
jgi:hypothetical protein